MAQMHDTGAAVKLTFGICRVRSGKPTGLRGVKRRNTNHREAFTIRIHKGISRMKIRIGNCM
jgi:hypothetical protein